MIKQWFINLIGGSTRLGVGSRVMTEFGPGVITSGAIAVRLDNGKPNSHKNDKTQTFNIDKISPLN